jgi:hypothetical protein
LRHPVCKLLPGKILDVPHINACISAVAEIAGYSILLMDRTRPLLYGPAQFTAQKGVTDYARRRLLLPAGFSPAQNERERATQSKYTVHFIHSLLTRLPTGFPGREMPQFLSESSQPLL